MTSLRPLVLTITALATIGVATGCAVERPPVPGFGRVAHVSGADAQRVAKLSMLSGELIAGLVSDDLPGCSAAVGVRGEVLWAAAAGLADVSTRAPLTTETRFDMASISKQFTATAVLLLQRDGLLALTDPVATHLDGLPDWANDVTVGELMHHTARVPDFWVELENADIGFTDPADQGTVLAAIARERELEPGDGYAYSNSHYVLLAEIVETVARQSFADFVDLRMATPLALDLAVAPGLASPEIATPYDDDLNEYRGGWTTYGHSGIVTTPTELVRWGDHYRTGEVVGDDITVGAAAVLDDEDQATGELYGAGIRVEPDGSLYHSGLWGGYISDLTITPDRETVIAVACNGRSAPRFELADGLRQIWSPTSMD